MTCECRRRRSNILTFSHNLPLSQKAAQLAYMRVTVSRRDLGIIGGGLNLPVKFLPPWDGIDTGHTQFLTLPTNWSFTTTFSFALPARFAGPRHPPIVTWYNSRQSGDGNFGMFCICFRPDCIVVLGRWCCGIADRFMQRRVIRLRCRLFSLWCSPFRRALTCIIHIRGAQRILCYNVDQYYRWVSRCNGYDVELICSKTGLDVKQPKGPPGIVGCIEGVI